MLVQIQRIIEFENLNLFNLFARMFELIMLIDLRIWYLLSYFEKCISVQKLVFIVFFPMTTFLCTSSHNCHLFCSR